MKHIFQEVNRVLTDGQSVALATIIHHAGSSPRATGARMLVHPDGTIAGTIGGGLLEAEAIEQARECLHSGRPRVSAWNFNGARAGDLGMICGGQVEILFQPFIPADPAARALFEELTGCIDRRSPSWLITRVNRAQGEGGLVTVRQTVISPENIQWENLSRDMRPDGKGVRGAAAVQPRWIEIDGEAALVEPVAALETAVIFGAGHVSQMLASLTGWVGFRTVVVDDRAEFANRERFPQADEVLAVESYRQAFEALEIGLESYLVIVTRGHKDDLEVVDLALRTSARYIGMIGSRRKRELVFQALAERGFAPAEIARVHSPIGMDIGAETPEEIGVSIAGELIKARAGLL